MTSSPGTPPVEVDHVDDSVTSIRAKTSGSPNAMTVEHSLALPSLDKSNSKRIDMLNRLNLFISIGEQHIWTTYYMDPSFTWMQAIKISNQAAKAPVAPRMFSASTPVPTGTASDMMATTPAIQLHSDAVLRINMRGEVVQDSTGEVF